MANINWKRVWRQFNVACERLEDIGGYDDNDKRIESIRLEVTGRRYTANFFQGWEAPGGQGDLLRDILRVNGVDIRKDSWNRMNKRFETWYKRDCYAWNDWRLQQNWLRKEIERMTAK